MRLPFDRFQVAIGKIACLVLLFGGPLAVYDDFRPILGKVVALVMTIAPVVLFYFGTDGLAAPSDGIGRFFLKLGITGVLLMVPMNVYVYWRLAQGAERREGLQLTGAVIDTVILTVFLVLAARALRRSRSAAESAFHRQFDGPIE